MDFTEIDNLINEIALQEEIQRISFCKNVYNTQQTNELNFVKFLFGTDNWETIEILIAQNTALWMSFGRLISNLHPNLNKVALNELNYVFIGLWFWAFYKQDKTVFIDVPMMAVVM